MIAQANWGVPTAVDYTVTVAVDDGGALRYNHYSSSYDAVANNVRVDPVSAGRTRASTRRATHKSPSTAQSLRGTLPVAQAGPSKQTVTAARLPRRARTRPEL
jgi:hypothetical protein